MKTLSIGFLLKTNNTQYEIQYRYRNKQGFCSIWLRNTMFTRECPIAVNRAFHDYFHRKLTAQALNEVLVKFFEKYV